ncbi:MAG: SpoIIE family protein phosphatase [Spirochaetes bacterium]|nr:SpoIIE family protein phosphatase [Spirochaetota bacterium]
MSVKIRKIRFGIRFKFSVIMIAGVAFTSALIGMAVFKQQEQNINNSIRKWGTGILKIPMDNAQRLLQAEHVLYSPGGRNLTPHQINTLSRQMGEAKRELGEYFSSIVRREPGIDIAFIIRVNWNDARVPWNRWDQGFYRYYGRRTGSLFTIKSGRFDDQLKPSIFSHFMQNLDLDTHVASITTASRDGLKEYILLGMPIFRNSPQVYRDYLATKKSPAVSKADRNADNRRFTGLFLDRIMDTAVGFDYDVILASQRDRRIVYGILMQDYQTAGLTQQQRRDIFGQYAASVDSRIESGRIPASAIVGDMEVLIKKHGLLRRQYPPGQRNAAAWNSFYATLKRYGIKTEPTQTLDELAMIAYRMDLAGIQGFFVTRSEFYSEMDRNRNEIIDLILSILLRCVFIAIFFPTFLIRSISTLAQGAYAIGRGKFETKIEVKGSDEIGRLADILNVMTKNLKKAREEAVVKNRMEEELKTAQEIQEALLPKELPVLKGIQFGAYYSAQTESGGDYYDFIPMGEDRMGLAIADVSGHGVGPGLVMAMTRTLLHMYCGRNGSIKESLSGINDYLYRNTESSYFVTMFFGILDLGSLELQFSCAGHNPGIILRKDGVQEIGTKGIALGALDSDVFDTLVEVKRGTLQKGSYFIQYTDGVVESMDSERNEYGEERFHGVLQANYGRSPEDIIGAVMEDINRFTGRIPQHDDITMIVLKIS